MTNSRNVIAGLITAAALAASSSFVYAQAEKAPGQGGYQSGGPGAYRGEMGHGPRAGHQSHDRWSNPAAKVEGFLAALKVELKITPDQDKAWQTFATKTRQQAEARNALRAQRTAEKPATNLTAPARMAQRTAFMKQRLASMEAMAAAVTELYGVLTPEQKAIADKQFAHGRRGHSGGHHQRS